MANTWNEKTALEKKLIKGLSKKNRTMAKIEEMSDVQIKILVKMCLKYQDMEPFYELIEAHDEAYWPFYYHGTGMWLGFPGSTIKEGKHYSINGKYLGSVKRLGTEPIDYEGYFEVNRGDFETGCFELKKDITEEDISAFSSRRIVNHLFNKKE